MKEVEAMEDKCLLSVIIPVYNMQNYLERCVDSVLRNAIDSMQVILVDDGSKDESPAICDRYAQENEMVEVIHQQNSGLSASRNNGFEIARGKYIFYLDSDDAVQDGIFAKFRDYVKTRGADVDMLFFDCIFVHDVTGVETLFRFPVKEEEIHNVTGQQALKMLLAARPSFEWYCWRYFYRRQFLLDNELKYLEGVMFEDVPWTSQALLLAQCVDYMPEVGLRYTNFRKGSIVNSMSLKKVRDKLTISENSCKFDLEYIKDQELLDSILSNHAEFYIGAFRNFCDAVPEAYPYLKDYHWMAKYSRSRLGRLVYKLTSVFGFPIGCRLARLAFKVLGLDK
jgi:glycosyltransferase involved in cell wall biosynthesis